MTRINFKFCICPYCGKQLELISRRVDELYYCGLCRNCLLYLDVNCKELSSEEIRELASEG